MLDLKLSFYSKCILHKIVLFIWCYCLRYKIKYYVNLSKIAKYYLKSLLKVAITKTKNKTYSILIKFTTKNFAKLF